MDDYILRFPFRITTAESDMEGRLKPGDLVNFLVQSAINSAEILGFGWDILHHQHLFWVLHRLTVQVEKTAKWNDILSVETWPKTIDGLLYLRDFMVADQNQEIVARATSGWLAVNRVTKRPGKVSTLHPEKFSSLKNKHGIRELPDKIPGLDPEEIKNTITKTEPKLAVKTNNEARLASAENPPEANGGFPECQPAIITPAWSDFDINRHVTSSSYIDWMIDMLPFKFLQNNYPTSLSVNFLKEILPEETIRLTSRAKGSDFLFEGSKEFSGIIAFRGRISF